MTTPITSNSAPSLQLLSESELVRTVLAEDYEILQELGRGGMAIVFRAREKALDREVAIKVLPARLAVDKEFVDRFEHEARTAAKLEHPNIVPIYRVGRAGPNGEVSYFVMKLLRGQSLSAVLRERGKLGAEDVRRILTETASALGYAARRNVVHRDIKPDNIMLDSEGRCVITDFGIAKAPGGQQTAAGTSLGTPRYMSPEHAGGSPLDGRSDMYSLGVVAYQCLIGNTPFDAEDPFAVLYKHINEPVPQPTLQSDDERQLYDVIARMLSKKPDDRFQTGNELIEALGGQISNPTLVPAIRTSIGFLAPTEMIPTPQPWYTPLWNQRSPAQRKVLIGVGIAAAALITVVLVNLSRGKDTKSPIVPNAASAQVALPSAANQSVAATAATDSIRKADSVKALASRNPAKTGPSPRVAAILAYNKLKSSCPKQRDTTATAKPIEYSVRIDSIRDRAFSDDMMISYDVCGLYGGSQFSTLFTLTKQNQHGIGKQPPHVEAAPGFAKTPRNHQRWKLNLKGLSPGDYQLDAVVTDSAKRQTSASRKFKLTDKQQ